MEVGGNLQVNGHLIDLKNLRKNEVMVHMLAKRTGKMELFMLESIGLMSQHQQPCMVKDERVLWYSWERDRVGITVNMILIISVKLLIKI